MAKHRKVYRFRMKPTAIQAAALLRNSGARRFIWNWGLARKIEHYDATGKPLCYVDLNKELTELKRQPGMEWLREASAQSLQEALRDLERAFVNFFEKRAKFPKFKSKKRDRARFRIPQKVTVGCGKVYVPKIGHIRIRQSRDVIETTKSATFRREPDGKWYVSLIVEFEMPDVPLPAPDPEKVVGIDLGLIDFATFSDGAAPIPAPKFYRKAQKKIRRAQKTVSRRKMGSKRRDKARIKLARIYQHVSNQRNDFLNKLSTSLVARCDGLCIEDLSLKGFARTKLAKSFLDAAMGEFRRQLEYKSLWSRKHLVVIDRFFPSSRMCNVCGVANASLKLSDREWDCDCGAHHKRDALAACNIREEGLSMLAVGQTGQPKRSGRDCKTRHSGHVSLN